MTRLIVFTSAFAIAASAAMAGDSVIKIKSRNVEAGSVITFDCSECPPVKPKFVSPDVHGVEVIEKNIDGKKKVVQMDNMMGGSAVRIVKATPETQNNTGDQNVVESWQKPFVADSGVTFEGVGEFNVDEVEEAGTDQPAQDGVDGGSQTSSVNMTDAEHVNVGPKEPNGEEPHNNGSEIIELRPSK
ncbi:MAG: hypothetical protein GY789_11770 [Hyphomicrobiales bacterium]|nr:hypothetical protein [Hyphomicrobiales bacterium]MCP4999797.1 hypothetical protein [Hyphomicrobiales bacterium]